MNPQNSQFDYARDNRSAKQLRQYWDVGLYNQEEAIKCFAREMVMLGHKVSRIKEYKETWMENGGNWQWQPDYLLNMDDLDHDVEVKTTNSPNFKTVELKVNQFKGLIERTNGHFLICTALHYTFFRPYELINVVDQPIKSEYFGVYKWVYSLLPHVFNWEQWMVNKPRFKEYPRREK